MKRQLFIIIGAVIVLILVCVWIYLLFFGTPNNNSIFTAFNLGDTTDESFVPGEATPSDEAVVDMTSAKRLRQLTTKNVIGYRDIQNSTSSHSSIYFAESGTGHIFSINLQTGIEDRVSASTIPAARVAKFSKNGTYVAVQTNNGSGLTLGELRAGSQELITSNITERIIDFSFSDEEELLYLVQTNTSSIGKVYSLLSGESRTLFTLPFREVTMVWGASADSNHFFYPKTTSRLEGFLYVTKGSTFNRLPADGYGFAMRTNGSYALFSKQQESEYVSRILSIADETVRVFPLTIHPEKCAFANTISTLAICGQTTADYNELTPDPWYQGTVTYTDSLWEISTLGPSALLILDTLPESGRAIDIINPAFSANDYNLFFQNKLDNSLWMFERIPTNSL